MNHFYLLLATQAAEGGEGKSLEAPTWLDFLHKMPWWPKWLPVQSAWALVVIMLLTLLCYFGTRRMQKVPKGLQNLLEMVVQALTGFVEGIMGPEGRKFVPFLGTLFIFIVTMNLIGLVPGAVSPTANLNTTLSMAIIVFFLVQYHGFRQSGLRYLLHFVGEPWWLFPLMLPLHIIAEFVRPVTLAFRLYGNIYGEEVAIISFIGLAASLPIYLRWWMPVQLPMMALACLTSFIQAMIFVLLTSVYLTLASGEHEH